LQRRADGRALRQAHLEEQLRPLGKREELLLDAAEPHDGSDEDADRREHGGLPPANAQIDDAAQHAVEPGLVDRMRVRVPMRGEVLGQQLHAEIGREDHGHEPGRDECDADNPEDAARIFAHRRIRETDGQEADSRHEGAREHREGGRAPRIGRGGHAVEALLHLHDHHLGGDDGIVHEKTERDDEGAERNAVQVDAERIHHHEGDGKHEGYRECDYDAGTQAEAQERDHEHDRERLHEGALEFPDRLVHHLGLIRNLLDGDALRHARHEGCRWPPSPPARRRGCWSPSPSRCRCRALLGRAGGS
jgi:hypothetical protein